VAKSKIKKHIVETANKASKNISQLHSYGYMVVPWIIGAPDGGIVIAI
jgi:hypothetical protein